MSKERKTEFIIIRVTKEEKTLIERIAKERGQNVSEFCREALEWFVKKYGK